MTELLSWLQSELWLCWLGEVCQGVKTQVLQALVTAGGSGVRGTHQQPGKGVDHSETAEGRSGARALGSSELV